MEKKITKKILAILMIITLLATDIFVLGSGLITYAAQIANEIEGYPNIHFSTYFKEGKNEIKEINKSIKNKNLKLYAKIGVNSDVDCLEDIQLNLKDCSFNIISSNKGTVEGNTVKLDYIGAGTLAEVELEIEPVFSNKISADMLLKTNLEVNAKYKHAKAPEGEIITASSESIVKYQPDETMTAELKTNIITNKVLEVNETNKRIIQLLVKSRLTDNQYPVEKTTLNVSIPKLGEQNPEINVLATGQLATNGLTQISEQNYTSDGENLQITIENSKTTNNEINWTKDAYDEMVVTFIYPENVDVSDAKITTSSEIKIYNLENPIVVDPISTTVGNENLSQVIMGRTEIISEEMYKGSLYANIDTEYKTKTTLVVTNSNVADTTVIHEGVDTFGTTDSELTVNTKYLKTEINKEKMIEILGGSANIQIKNGETVIDTITKDKEANSEGNIVINYKDYTTNFNEIDIVVTGQPKTTGILEINHTKVIIGKTYTRTELQEVKTINTKNIISAMLGETKIVENVIEADDFELTETISKAQLTIENNKETLSTTETNEVTLGITLNTNGVQYDLYKNPTIKLQFPSVVENVTMNTKPSKQNADEFAVSANYDSANKTMVISLTGEQTSYPESALTQAYLQLNLNVTLSQLATTKTDKIIMTYTNENASQYDGGTTDVGIVEKAIGISAQPGLIKIFNLNLNKDISIDNTIKQQITEENAGQIIEFETILVNNTDSDINNVKILGKLPTVGNTITGQNNSNSIETTLKSISAPNAKIYYTENVSATENLQDPANGWTTDISSLTNAKMYFIEVGSLSKASNYLATVKVQIPNSIEQNLESYTQYEVIYDTDTNTDIKEASRKIGLVTYPVSDLEISLTAQVGQDKLSNGDRVKEGEVIGYTVTVTNTSTNETYENAQLKLDVPEGTTYVTPIQGYTFNQGTEGEYVIQEGAYVYVQNAYYEEITDSEKLGEVTSRTISKLAPGAKTEIQYEVRVNTNNTAGTEILNKTTLEYNDSKIGTAELQNIIEESDIRVTIKRTIDKGIQLVAGGTTRYMVYVENLSDSTIDNLEMQILSDVFNVEKIENEEMFLYGEEIPEKISINKIQKNDLVYFSIYGSIKNDVKEMNTSIVVSDTNGNKYRSNLLQEIFPNLDATISLTSPQNASYLKDGDTVQYNITVKNTGEIEGRVAIEDVISDLLQVQSIAINGNVVKQIQDESNTETYMEAILNQVSEEITLKSGENAEIQITAKVGYIPEFYHGKVITNSAIVKVDGIQKDSSKIITHVLKSNLMQNENLENVTSGFAWLDSNGNGQKDSYEDNLAGIIVKLYDIATKSYIKDEEGNIVQTETDSKGEYNFIKVPNGSYLIVFDYDMSQYKHTTSFAEGVDTSINSKADLKQITVNENELIVGAIEVNDLKENVFYMNIGLEDGEEELPSDDEPNNPENPEDPSDPEKPTNPEDPSDPEKPEEDKKQISGLAWLDSNRNGQKESTETTLTGIKARLYNVATKDYLKSEDGNIVEAITDTNGKYVFNDIEKGAYIIIFEYDIEKYEPTIYLAEDVLADQNSKVILKKIDINGQEIIAAVTDTIDVQDNVNNINIGLKEKVIFDLELNKYISRIVVQNSKGTKAYDYKDKTLGKVEIHKKQLQGSLVVLEYTIKVKNTGEITGYARNIVDYLPSGLTFSSELNKDWYLSGNNLYTKSVENIELKPGEEKEISLILTKTMTGDNVGLINNRAEIYQDYNKYGESDIDSTPNNQVQSEDDFGAADVIIQVATGGSSIAYISLLMLNMVLMGIAIKLMIKNRIIKIPNKKGRR